MPRFELRSVAPISSQKPELSESFFCKSLNRLVLEFWLKTNPFIFAQTQTSEVHISNDYLSQDNLLIWGEREREGESRIE